MIAYHAPKWLPGGHAQTIYPLLITPAARAYRRERWETPDGDFIDLDWSAPAVTAGGQPTPAPLLVLFHGLEGSSQSHYSRALMRHLSAIGWLGVVVHFRGCSGHANRLPRAYHSGDSAEIDWIVRRLKAVYPLHALYAVGVSLGGNVLLKWLGEQGAAATGLLNAAAAVSAPLDLAACGYHLGRGFNRVYSRRFLATLKRAAAAKLERFPGLFAADRLRAATTIYAFDDLVTGPLHGFAGADDYWRRASSKPLLAAIEVPTLVVNARNDPFMPRDVLPTPAEVSRAVTLDFPRQGGHVGFVSGPFPGTLAWLPQRLLDFFEHAI